MFDLTRFIEDGHAKTSVCTMLLTAADVIKSDASSGETIESVLADGILGDCTAPGGGLTAEEADWVTREARYRIACTLGVPVESRTDPAIDATIAVLAIQPAERQARILELTADQYSTQPVAEQDAEHEPCMICGEPVTTFLCPVCEKATEPGTTKDLGYERITMFGIQELAKIVADARTYMPDSAAADLTLAMQRFLQQRHRGLKAATWLGLIRDAEDGF